MYTTISPLKTNGLHHPVGDGPLDMYRGASYNLNLFFLKNPFSLNISIFLYLFISSVAPNETPRNAAFILGLHCL